MNDKYDDKELAARIRDDSLTAFEILYDRYKKRCYYFSLKYLEDCREAEELVQIVFISVWEHRKTIDVSKSIKSYIYKSAINYIYNYLKKKEIRARYIREELQKPERSSNHIYDNINYLDLKKKLDVIIFSLPAQQRNIFTLSRFEELSNEEIARKLDLSVRTVENQIYRVTKIIKNHLKAEILY